MLDLSNRKAYWRIFNKNKRKLVKVVDVKGRLNEMKLNIMIRLDLAFPVYIQIQSGIGTLFYLPT